ncbi:MAG: DUF6250 domain-containing protein [Puniceicoccaceae bacterium]
MKLIFKDTFETNLDAWVVEQQPGGRVFLEQGKLVIEDQAGCSVWYREVLEAPVRIRYQIRASSKARVSDINCFWMASEPGHLQDHFYEGHQRDGSFASYDILQTYYVGMGGNYNETTRFRRYEGGGKRPLLPEHDLSDPAFMIEPDRTYTIELIAADGKAAYFRDGELLFEYNDPAFLDKGWFAFRTVLSRIEVDQIEIYQLSETTH